MAVVVRSRSRRGLAGNRSGDAELVAFRVSHHKVMSGELLQRSRAANDLMAIGAIRALRHAGRRVPEDVAVIGYHDIDIAANTDPPLTTIRQPAAEMARTMVDLLLRRVKNETVPDKVFLPVELVVRSPG